MIIKLSDISPIKMSVNPPKAVVDAKYCIIRDSTVYEYVGIGWVEIRTATESDYENIPQILTPHCSHCNYYESINNSMYCKKLQKRITARKRPCKYYKDK